MATIGERLMVEKATGKRVAKHQAADRILFQYIYHDTRATYKWYRKYRIYSFERRGASNAALIRGRRSLKKPFYL